MAAAFLTAELAAAGVSAVVASAGTDGPPGLPASAASIEVMEEVGIDLMGHRSRVIDVADIDQADLVLVMTRAHEQRVASRSGQAVGHIFGLGEFARLLDAAQPMAEAGPWELDRFLRTISSRSSRPSRTGLAAADEIDDPYGGSTDRYRLTRDRVSHEAEVIAAAMATHV